MTFPDRDSCSYLIRPVLHLSAHSATGAAEVLREYTIEQRSDTQLITTFFKAVPYSVTFTCSMHYEIIEPLTGEKLAIHKLDSEPIIEKTTVYTGEIWTAT